MLWTLYMKKFFAHIRRKCHKSPNDSNRHSFGANVSNPVIQLVRGAYNIDLMKVDSSFTKLHRACYLNKEVKKVRKYLRKGYEPNSIDNVARSSPLHLAAVNGDVDIVKVLVEYGANPNLQDGDGRTALMKSIECFRHNCVQFFVLHGCDLNVVDFQYGNTALHLAILNNYSLACLFLLKYSQKLDVNKQNIAGESPLHLLIEFPDLHKFIPDILDNGADPNIEDNLGRTPLVLAKEHELHEVYRMMENHLSLYKNLSDISIIDNRKQKLTSSCSTRSSHVAKTSTPIRDRFIGHGGYLSGHSISNSSSPLPHSNSSSIHVPSIESSSLDQTTSSIVNCIPDGMQKRPSSIQEEEERGTEEVDENEKVSDKDEEDGKELEKDGEMSEMHSESMSAPFLRQLRQLNEKCNALRGRITQEQDVLRENSDCVVVNLNDETSLIRIKFFV